MRPIRCALTAGLWVCLSAGIAHAQAMPPQPGFAKVSQFSQPAPGMPGSQVPLMLSPPPSQPVQQPVQGVSMTAPAWNVGNAMMGGSPAPYAGEPVFAGGAMPGPVYGGEVYGMGGCPDGTCDPDDCSGGGLFGGAAATFLKPHFDDDAAFFLEDTTTPDQVTTAREFDYDMDSGVRVWGGWVSCSGLGFRGQYWSHEDDSDVESFVDVDGNFIITGPELDIPTLVGPSAGLTDGDSIEAVSGIDVDVADAEIIQYLRPGSWQMAIGGGVRYASIDQFYIANVFDTPNVEITTVEHDFDGIGPTMFVELRRPLFDSGLSFVTKARGAVVFGESEYEANDIFPGFTDTGSREEDETLGIGEVQVGAEYAIWTASQRRVYVQANLEGQYWAGAGSAASTDGDLGFAGFNAAAGIDY